MRGIVVAAVAGAIALAGPEGPGAPTVGPEVWMPGSVHVPERSTQRFAAAAWNGAGALVVWADDRTGATRIWAARVSGAGVLLDAAGIPLPGPDGTMPAAAWDGSSWVVVWDRGGSGVGGARVGPDGAARALDGLSVDPGRWPVIACGPGRCLVVSSGPQSLGGELVAADDLVEPLGTTIVEGSVAIWDDVRRSAARAAVARAGDGYLVVWPDVRDAGGYLHAGDVYGARVSDAGVVQDPNGIPIATGAFALDVGVASDGTMGLVVWADDRNAGTSEDVYAARVRGGVVLDPGGIPVSTAPEIQSRPAVGWDGTGFLVAWSDQRTVASPPHLPDVYAARVGADGVVADPGGIAFGVPLDPWGAAQVAGPFVVWDVSPIENADVNAARVAGGVVQEPGGLTVSIAGAEQLEAVVASDGADYLVVWTDDGGPGNLDIRGARVSAAGLLLDAAAIPISTAPGDQWHPAVAWDGTSWVVAWQDGRSGACAFPDGGAGCEIRAARLGAAGDVRDPEGIRVASGAAGTVDPAVASSPRGSLVVFRDVSTSTVAAVRVSTAGAVQDPTPVAVAAAGWGRPAVATDGAGYLVVWAQGGAIRGARVSATGRVLDPSPIAIVAGDASYPPAAPAVAWAGTSYLVAWEDQRNGERFEFPAGVHGFLPYHGIYAARVSGSGVVRDRDGLPLSPGTPLFERGPAVAADGAGWLVVWEWNEQELHGARVAPGGAFSPVVLATGMRGARPPAVASAGSGQLLLADSTFDGTTDVQAHRVFARAVATEGFAPEPEKGSGSCGGCGSAGGGVPVTAGLLLLALRGRRRRSIL